MKKKPKHKPRPVSPAQRARDEREAQRERFARALFHYQRGTEEAELNWGREEARTRARHD